MGLVSSYLDCSLSPTVEVSGLNPVQYRFESDREYHPSVVQRMNSTLRMYSMQVRILSGGLKEGTMGHRRIPWSRYDECSTCKTPSGCSCKALQTKTREKPASRVHSGRRRVEYLGVTCPSVHQRNSKHHKCTQVVNHKTMHTDGIVVW